MVWLALRRAYSQRWLILATSLGLAIAVAFTLCIPLYADAVHFRLLRQRLGADKLPGQTTPLPFLLRYRRTSVAPWQWADIQPIDDYLTSEAVDSLRLPILRQVRFFRTNSFQLYPSYDPANPKTKYLYDYFFFATLQDAGSGADRGLKIGLQPPPAPEKEGSWGIFETFHVSKIPQAPTFEAAVRPQKDAWGELTSPRAPSPPQPGRRTR